MYVLECQLFMHPQEGYFGAYFPSCTAMMEINTKITLKWANKQFIMKVHRLFYFLLEIKINDDKNSDFHTLTPESHSLGWRSADDITIDC